MRWLDEEGAAYAAILALNDPKIKAALDGFRAAQTKKVAEAKLP